MSVLVALEAPDEGCRILGVGGLLLAGDLGPLVAAVVDDLVDGNHEEEEASHHHGHANHCS